MTPAEMGRAAVKAINYMTMYGGEAQKAAIICVTPPSFKPPKGFPRGELLQVKEDGSRLKRYNALRILAWLHANKLVEVRFDDLSGKPEGQ